MKFSCLLLFSILVSTYALRLGKRKPSAQSYLVRYGYLKTPKVNESLKVGMSVELKPEEVQKSIRLFQLRNGLNVTGVLDSPTEKKLLDPRCGVEDIQEKPNLGSWKSKLIKYKLIGRLTPKLDESSVRQAFEDAFNYWSDVIPLDFIEVFDRERADINIRFQSWEHGDGYDFDGEGGALAHAFYPEDGRIHLDRDELFTEDDPQDGHNLRVVAAHEVGHSLGLPHSHNPDALMAAYYSRYVPRGIPLLEPEDVVGIQAIYGVRTTTKSPQIITPKSITKKVTTKLTTKASTVKPIARSTMESVPIPNNPISSEIQWDRPSPGPSQPDICNPSTKITTVFMGKDSKLYFVIDHSKTQWIYRHKLHTSRIEKQWPVKFKDIFREDIPNIQAAVYTTSYKIFFMFSGTKMLIIDQFGYFYDEYDVGMRVKCAFTTPEGRLVAVNEAQELFEIDAQNYKLQKYSSLSSLFPGIPRGVSVTHIAQDYPWSQNIAVIFFFNQNKYYKYSVESKTFSEGRYSVQDAFFGCRRYPVPL